MKIISEGRKHYTYNEVRPQLKACITLLQTDEFSGSLRAGLRLGRISIM